MNTLSHQQQWSITLVFSDSSDCDRRLESKKILGNYSRKYALAEYSDAYKEFLKRSLCRQHPAGTPVAGSF
jgi:hypothetical protein